MATETCTLKTPACEQLFNHEPRTPTLEAESAKATSREGWIKLEGRRTLERAKQLFVSLENLLKPVHPCATASSPTR